VKPGPQIPVAVFITSFHPGGTERQMTELIHRLDRSRFDVRVACTHKEGPWLRQVEASAPVTAFPIRGFAHPTMVAQGSAFARWCRAERIAVVQSCELYGNVFALPFAAMAGVPVRVGSRRELNPDKTRTQLAVQRQAYRCAHAIVANSTAASRQLEQEGIRADRIAIIPNGVDLERFAVPRAPRPVTTVVTVANLRKEKGHEVLLAAAARLVLRHPHLRFLLAGDGPRMSELRAMAGALHLDDHVRFLGHREDIPALLAEADLFVLPSRSEAFPNGAIEAMAAGLPVVANAVGGLLDLIDDGETGVLVRPDDAVALGDAIEALVRSPEQAAAIGANARDAVARRYSFDRMVRGFEDLYLTHLGMPRGVSSRAA
jgi:glycosyltransferase involved in cell wall biosynthesis